MRVASLLTWSVACAVAGASRGRPYHASLQKRQDGPVDPGINKLCTLYVTPHSKTEDCSFLASNWGVSLSEFVQWNPAVKADCSGIVAGHSYCVQVSHGQPVPTQSKPSVPTPSPIQDGLTKDCTAFYQATKGDVCDKIVAKFATFSLGDFIRWNPSAGQDCSGLRPGYYYCVDVAGTPTAPVTSPLGPTGSPKPSPTQSGLTESCTTFYKAAKGDLCSKIVQRFGTFTQDDFVKWNPAVGADCAGLWSDYYYCVGVPGTPTQRPTTTTSDARPTTTTTKPGNGIETPLPTQPGMIDTCTKFYKVQKGDGCQVIATKQAIALGDFIKWNPSVGADCHSLFADYYVCVGAPGAQKPDPPSNVPSPTQPGIAAKCDKYYQAAAGDTCQLIVDKFKSFQLETFYKWNPAVGNDCSGLWAGYYYCVDVPGAFHLKTFYHANCTGAIHNDVMIADESDGSCIDTSCAAASINTDAVGLCPDGQVQLSYWEKPGCSGNWFGYGYTSRGTCHKLWTEGWKFKSLHLRCASEKEDCVSKGTCTYRPEPAARVC